MAAIFWGLMLLQTSCWFQEHQAEAGIYEAISLASRVNGLNIRMKRKT
jgi:hypothetical protein